MSTSPEKTGYVYPIDVVKTDLSLGSGAVVYWTTTDGGVSVTPNFRLRWAYYSSTGARLGTSDVFAEVSAYSVSSMLGPRLHYYHVSLPTESEVPSSYFCSYGTYDKCVRIALSVCGVGNDGSESGATYSQVLDVLVNTPPVVSDIFSVPSPIQSGETFQISWGEATDIDGNFSHYVLQRCVSDSTYTSDSSVWTEIYNGTSTSTTDLVVAGTNYVSYLLQAHDIHGAFSEIMRLDVAVSTNSPPPAPSYLELTGFNGTLYSGNTVNVNWDISIDPDGNIEGYVLELYNSHTKNWDLVVKGMLIIHPYLVGEDHESLYFRVKAYDSEGAESAYTYSATYPVITNTPPEISDYDRNLGTYGGGKGKLPTLLVTVSDAQGGTISVEIKVDGSLVQSASQTFSSQPHSYTFEDKVWWALGLGSHVISITATDSLGASATRTFTFTKAEDEIYLTYSSPYVSNTMPTVGILNVTTQIPEGASFTVEVCNNGFDASPTWENVTAAVKQGGRFYFSNETKTASQWGFNTIIEVKRNGASGDCYVREVSGYFR